MLIFIPLKARFDSDWLAGCLPSCCAAMEVATTSETSVNNRQTTRHNSAEDDHLETRLEALLGDKSSILR